MLCGNCGERRAEIHLVKVINGVRIEEDICRTCAEQLMPFHEAAKALKMSFSLEGIMNAEEALRSLLLPMLPELYESEGKDMKCPHCGKNIDADELFDKLGDKPKGERDIVFDFSHMGNEADAVGAAEADASEHVPAPLPDLRVKNELITSEKELAGLRRELEFVLRGERYERAAEIRDRISELEKTISEKSKGA